MYNLSGCVKLIIEPTDRLCNCLVLLLTDAFAVVDLPLGNFDHSSISFILQLGYCIPSLKSCVKWSRVRQEFTWGNVYNSPNSVNAFNELLTFIISRIVLTKIRRLTDKARFDCNCINDIIDKQNVYYLWKYSTTQLEE